MKSAKEVHYISFGIYDLKFKISILERGIELVAICGNSCGKRNIGGHGSTRLLTRLFLCGVRSLKT
jgi:hypothetical protein